MKGRLGLGGLVLATSVLAGCSGGEKKEIKQPVLETIPEPRQVHYLPDTTSVEGMIRDDMTGAGYVVQERDSWDGLGQKLYGDFAAGRELEMLNSLVCLC